MNIVQKDVDALVQDNLSFVHFILKKYYPPEGYDYDDLYQIGCIGLVKAAKKFDPSLGYQFTTYAAYWIENELKKMIRTQKAVKRTGDVFSMDWTGEDEDGSLAELLANYDSVEEEVEAKWLFSELIRQEPAITMLALQGYTQKEIGRKLGMSQVSVSRKLLNMRKATAAMC
ncbi:sigma-70 family RNA polymerase sigma factor [Brevibacillus composti]|uniref:Sigma-70 family RNA polymerase sigma factor n=1 Tax=Brevibacillus composti TaxID=2796470 RepID=A0A7T5ENC0_9BACL|nr:sigma-70 family RNA polymerase sigma factor [Brevibacillus composti]QQE75702.1 sigma-70 family RNA polymerase sigma factor [Brevibacillus composti]QUO42728.1 sigma-70 family RNA polymerase sigma factor [Brevibacillus composti]